MDEGLSILAFTDNEKFANCLRRAFTCNIKSPNEESAINFLDYDVLVVGPEGVNNYLATTIVELVQKNDIGLVLMGCSNIVPLLGFTRSENQTNNQYHGTLLIEVSSLHGIIKGLPASVDWGIKYMTHLMEISSKCTVLGRGPAGPSFVVHNDFRAIVSPWYSASTPTPAVIDITRRCLKWTAGTRRRKKPNAPKVSSMKNKEIPPSTMNQDLIRLMTDENFVDVTFKVEGKTVTANKAVLAARCEYFYKMFYGNMKESNESKEIDIPVCNHDAFVVMIRYLLTDVLEITPETVVDVMALSEMLLLDRPKAICNNFIYKSIKISTAIPILIKLHDHDMKEAKQFCLSFIRENITEIKKQTNFDDLLQCPDLLLIIAKMK